MRRLVAITAVGSAAVGLLVAVAPAVPATAATAATGAAYTPLTTPTRIANAVSVPSKGTASAGLTGVPSDATAVALNVTAVGGSAQGYLTVYTGSSRPGTSSVNFVPGQTVANATVVQDGGASVVRVFNGSSAAAHFYLDVTGYWTAASAGQGSFGSIAPTRVLNTSGGVGAKGPLGARGTLSFDATGGSTGIPDSASAVLINLTVANPAKPGNLTAYAGTRPSASTLSFSAKATLAHLALVPVSSSGRVSVYNSSGGTVQLFGDVLGWTAAGDPVSAGAFGVLNPYRELSSRTIASHTSISFSSAGRGGVPKSGVSALALNVRVAKAANRGYLAVDPGSPVATSNLNFVKGQSIANLVLAGASGGSVRVYNGSSSSIEVSADVTGYVLAADAAVPSTSTSRYVRNITGAAGDASIMSNEGQSDCTSGSRLVLLDIGAQSNTNSPASDNGVVLSASTPGVRLSALDPPVRLTYVQLVAALKGYLDGFGSCTGTGTSTIAVGTSNDGDWTAYPAASKASDWATKVIGPLQSYATSKGYAGESIVGASDIEAGFGSTAAQARTWVTNYLGDAGPGSMFIDAGSLDNCATAYGSTADCGAVSDQTGPTWKLADYKQLTSAISPGRIRVLPQIYFNSNAVQWANLDKYAGGALVFAGALTEHAAACGSLCELTPGQGWAALQHALSTVVSNPSIPQLTDLRIDSPAGAGAAARRPGSATPDSGA